MNDQKTFGHLTRAFLVVVAFALAGCNGSSTPAPTPTPPPGPAPTPTPTPPPTPPPAPPPTPVACDATRTAAPTGRNEAERLDVPSARIVGGVDALPGAWPWAAAIALTRSDGSLFQYCGGSLIDDDWVLTAAHCEVEPGDKIILGRSNLTASGGEVLDVDFVLTHIDYDGATNDNDIALVKLASASGQAPIALIDTTETGAQPSDLATIIGWGRTSEGGSSSPTALQQVEVPIQTTAQCQLGYTTTITPNMVCAGTNQGGTDSCQGDSGGPLMARANPQAPWSQAGVVSFGIGCARPGVFGVYTRVARYIGWVAACQANPP